MKNALFRLAMADIERGHGTATVTLRSGAQFAGMVNGELSKDEVLHLSTDTGWHMIDWDEIVAVTGAP